MSDKDYYYDPEWGGTLYTSLDEKTGEGKEPIQMKWLVEHDQRIYLRETQLIQDAYKKSKE